MKHRNTFSNNSIVSIIRNLYNLVVNLWDNFELKIQNGRVYKFGLLACTSILGESGFEHNLTLDTKVDSHLKCFNSVLIFDRAIKSCWRSANILWMNRCTKETSASLNLPPTHSTSASDLQPNQPSGARLKHPFLTMLARFSLDSLSCLVRRAK